MLPIVPAATPTEVADSGAPHSIKMGPKAEANVWSSYDNSPEWHKAATCVSERYRTHVLNVVPARCQSYRVRLEGYGEAALIALSKVIGEGSEIHGTL